jgi:hypothetical protein
MSERSDWDPYVSPNFFAWCDEEQRLEALVVALSELFAAKGGSVDENGFDFPTLSSAEVIQRIRIDYASNEGLAGERFAVECPSGRAFDMAGVIRADRHLHAWSGPIKVGSYHLPNCVHLAKMQRSHSLEAAAAVACHVVIVDLEDILLRLCTPHLAITTGVCGGDNIWSAPILMAATYHADGCVGRDLALSWIHLHDNERLELAAGLPLDALRERVEAAPRGATISVRDKGILTREEVLAALALGADVLLEALEAAAVPDNEWLTVEPLVQYAIEAARRGAHTVDVFVFTEPHVRFIQHHAPFHVRGLPNGGVMLATHPYRTLWPLWADALDLLGIRPERAE